MRKTVLIAQQEFSYLLRSPLAWVIFGTLFALSAWYFLQIIETFSQSAHQLMQLPQSPGVTGFVIVNFYLNISLFFLMIVPLLTMHSLQREKSSSGHLFIETAPVSHTQLVLGKFLGQALFLLMTVFFIALMPLSLKFGANIDLRLIALANLGLWLLLCSFIAMSLFFALANKEIVVAICLSFGFLFLLRMLDYGATISAGQISVLEYLANFTHYNNFARGLFSPVSVIYFLLSMLCFLGLSIRHLDFIKSRA